MLICVYIVYMYTRAKLQSFEWSITHMIFQNALFALVWKHSKTDGGGITPQIIETIDDARNDSMRKPSKAH